MDRIIYDVPRWSCFLHRDARGLPSVDLDDLPRRRFEDELFERLYAGEIEALSEQARDSRLAAWAEKVHAACDQLPDFARLSTECRGDALAAVESENAEVRARRAELKVAERRTEQEVRTTLLELEAADRHARLHADKLIPVADVALKSAEAAYQNGRIDLLSVLESARMLRDHHFNHVRYLVEYQRRLAELERLMGTDLTQGVGR